MIDRGQGVLGEMPPTAPVLPEDVQRSFSTMVRPDVWGLDPANYTDLTQRAVDAAAADRLRPSLIGVDRNSHSAVGYMPGGETRANSTTWIALNPAEHRLIIRSFDPAYLAETAFTTVLASKPAGSRTVAIRDAAERSQAHAVEGKLTKMQEYLDGTLLPEQARLKRFSEYALHAGS